MPYFSFSLKKSIKNSLIADKLLEYNLKPNTLYFSKNTNIWKILNIKKISNHFNVLSYEKRNSYISGKNSVLFLMPPSIGLGDSIEYALALDTLNKKKVFNRIGIGFVEKYNYIFSNIFKMQNIYDYVITKENLQKYDTVFHFSKELIKLQNQKYNRSDIEKEICDYFNIKIERVSNNKVQKIKKLTIFPISTSPIRTMPVELINLIILKFSNKIKLEIVMDDFYPTSKFLISKINSQNVKMIFHKNIEELINIVKAIQYGVFVDSGPLHLAKIFNKKGLFIETSVNYEKLLNKFNNIEVIKNQFKSDYCNGPCGLTNLFNIKKTTGCYFTNKINKDDFSKIQNTNALQRGILKTNYEKFMEYPVGCIKNIDLKKILNTIESKL